jgi:hypothetical protein
MGTIDSKHSALINAISDLQSHRKLDDRQATFVLMSIIEEMQSRLMYREVDVMLNSLYFNGNYGCVLGTLRCTYKYREYYKNWDRLNARIERAK